MSVIFIDTSFLLALASESDALHARALLWQSHLRGPFVTTEFVLLEVGDALTQPEDRSLACSIIEDLVASATVEIVPCSTALLGAGLALFKNRADKAWGLTDCISFHVMRDREILDALSHDHHFEQAGFRALLRTVPPDN